MATPGRKKGKQEQGHQEQQTQVESEASAADDNDTFQSKQANAGTTARQPSIPPSPQHARTFRIRTAEHDADLHASVIQQIKHIYMNKVRPIEAKYKFHKFGFAPITEAEIDAKAQVLFVGPYSTGKTTMVKYLLGQEFPGIHVGPEPTTDRFVCVVQGNEEKVIQGNSVTVMGDLPYGGTEQFGSTFLERFQASVSKSAVLEHLTFIDTPGVLAGKKQRQLRDYDFCGVTRWFAERSDLILLLFDAYKLDISDEFEEVMQELKEHDAKVRLVLNKADHLSREHLTRVYGALMYSVGKVVRSPEVPRVYVGSFWEQPRKYEDPLFTHDEETLLQELADLPRMSPIRKINDLVRRVRMLKVYVCLMSAIRSRMPYFQFRHAKARDDILAQLPAILEEVRVQYDLSPGDLPPMESLRLRLSSFPDFLDVPPLKSSVLDVLDEVKDKDIPRLMRWMDGAGGAEGRPPGSPGQSTYMSMLSKITRSATPQPLIHTAKVACSAVNKAASNGIAPLLLWYALLVAILAVIAGVVYMAKEYGWLEYVKDRFGFEFSG